MSDAQNIETDEAEVACIAAAARMDAKLAIKMNERERALWRTAFLSGTNHGMQLYKKLVLPS